MALVNCPNCHKVFPGNKGDFCPECLKKDNEGFEKLKEYLVANPDSSADKAAEDTGVDIKVVLRLLHAGRLEVKRPKGEPACASCGTPIESGVYCPRCSAAKKGPSRAAKDEGPAQDTSQGDALSPIRKTKKGQIHSRRIRRKTK